MQNQALMNFKEWWFTSLRPLFVKGSMAVSTPVEPFIGFRQDGQEPLLNPSTVKEAEEAQEAVQLILARAASQARMDVQQVSGALTRACRETDPAFLRLGQDLQEIFGAAMGLTNSVQQAASHLSQGEEGMTCLDRAGFLVENAWKSLTGEQENIEKSLDHVRKLLDHLQKFSLVCDRITRIGLWFRVVGVNIEIECNVQHLSGDMFAGVSKEVNVLSGQINQMVAGMKNGLVTAISGLSVLEGSSSRSLAEIGQMAEKAQGIVRNSYENIQQLLAETVTLIDTATARARIIGAKAGDVVVGIQFQDSMSQRIEHIVEAMQDIAGLCETSRKAETLETGETARTLGSVYFILDLQKKQLENLRGEIRELALTTQDSFQIINGEIIDMRGELAGSRLTGNGRNGSGADCFKPLQQGLRHLGKLLTTGNTMNDALHQSTEEIASVADQLLGMIVGVRNIREETHIKAINTIIMANHLGSQGTTIEVLAKEIRSLADQTGELAVEVSIIQADIVREVAGLRAAVAEEITTITVPELEEGVDGMGASFQQVQEEICGVTRNTAAIAEQIGGVAARLSFLEDLGCKIEDSIGQVERILADLEPWRDSGQVHDENILRLLERYTMDQERLVHMPMDGSRQTAAADNDFELFSGGAEEQGTADVTLFDDNVELF